ncbi:MAG: histone deacetylase [Deltaproteobacteria bacterium]|jgi:acetoin utilization deacetylase AcuC-like enzyme|nr:histone deacetylase [Deltaproteobacteria bacterium]
MKRRFPSFPPMEENVGPDKLGVVFFPAFDWGISPSHPEREERLLYTFDQLTEEGLFDIPGVRLYSPEQASFEDIERVHFCLPDAAAVCPPPHRIAAGGAIKAASLVMEKKAEKAFALTRPPGHHAMRVVSSGRGFCQINVEAVMVEYTRRQYGNLRVAIVDTDCHHGDGTQDIYWHDPNTLFISIHQDGRTLYPGSGFGHELGGPNARGRTLNAPLPPGSGDEAFLYLIDNLVLPALADFKPDLIINSAGQDNHYTDPITAMSLSAQGYAELSRRLSPHVAVLEGGYSIQGALPYVNLGIALALAGKDYSQVREPDYASRRRDEGTGLEEAKRLCGPLLDAYFSRPAAKRGLERDGLHTTEFEVYYDTTGVRERRRDTVALCDACAGALFIEAISSVTPLSACVYTPLSACAACREKAASFLRTALGNGSYTIVRGINRPDDSTTTYRRKP